MWNIFFLATDANQLPELYTAQAVLQQLQYAEGTD
jgi:hypothetical protein